MERKGSIDHTSIKPNALDTAHGIFAIPCRGRIITVPSRLANNTLISSDVKGMTKIDNLVAVE
jgi:hypothetical protein